jgi:ADP-ribose pyrophosphatase YjhB (NUDIX family)
MSDEEQPWYEARFHVHVDAIVRRGDDVLIMKRAMGAMSGAWYFPGGGLEIDESPEDGIRREIREETELEVEDLRLFKVWHYLQDESTPAVGISFTCSVPPGTEARINEEHSATRWVTPRYYRDRYLNDDIVAAIAGNALAHKLVSGVRALVDDYLASAGS